MPPDYRRYWMRQAWLMMWRHRLARLLQAFLPVAVGLCVAAAAVLLVLRFQKAPVEWVWPGFAIALALAALGSGWRMRRRALSLPQALVRLEVQGHLYTRLSAARAGQGTWPAPHRVHDATRWRWSRLTMPLLLAAGLLFAARWMPLPLGAFHRPPPEQPLAWSQVQTWAETLEQARVVEPEALKRLESTLRDLQRQQPEKWYSQGSLEAGDTLRQQAEQALRGLQSGLENAQQLAAAARQAVAAGRTEELQKMAQNWAQALNALGAGQMPLNPELQKLAKQFQPGSGRQLSQEQMQQLQEQLGQAQKIVEQCVGPSLRKLGQGGEREGRPNSGGPGGGGETAPLTFKNKGTDLRTKNTEALQAAEVRNPLPGEQLGLSAGEHEVREHGPKITEGGAIASPGEGGAAVWHESVLPRERAVLEKFFK